MASNRQWCVTLVQFSFILICAPFSLPSACRRIATIRRAWIPSSPLIARLSRFCVESQVHLSPASLSTPRCAWKAAALQPDHVVPFHPTVVFVSLTNHA